LVFVPLAPMSSSGVPLGYRSLQDFLLRWHDRNSPLVAAAAAAPGPAVPPQANALMFPVDPTPKKRPKSTRAPPRHDAERSSFYERAKPAEILPSEIRPPPATSFVPIDPRLIVSRP
jgi:hypothetical protein